MNREEKPNKRRLAAGAVALFTSASMMVGGIFHTPADLPEQTDILPPPIVLDEDDLDGDGKNKKTSPPPEAAGEEETAPAAVEAPEREAALPEEEKKGLRRWWGALSFRRRLLLIPLCALLGWGVFALAGALLPGVLGRALAWLATLAALGAGFVAAEKALFPDIPVRELLRTGNFAGLLGGLAALGAADLLLPLVWSGYARWELLIHGAGIVLVFSAAGLSWAQRTRKKRLSPQPGPAEEAEEPEEEEEKPMTREDILALADTVSRKRR